MHVTAWFASTTVFLLLMTSVISFYLAASFDHTGRTNRLGGPTIRFGDRSHLLLRAQPQWHWVPQWVINWQLRHLDQSRHEPGSWFHYHQRQLTWARFSDAHATVAFRLIQFGTITLGAALGYVVSYSRPHASIAYVILGISLGYLLPEYTVRQIAQKRKLRVARELPAAIDLMVVTLEAGLSIGDAIRIAGHEMSRLGYLIGRELATASAEMRAGLSLEDSLQNLAERTGSDDVRALAALLIQSEKIGGRLGPPLRASADLLSFNRRQRAEEAAQRSAIKMLVPLVLLILPAMMIIILGPAGIQIIEVIRGATH
jgi:Flp pilus assembly protein TadB